MTQNFQRRTLGQILITNLTTHLANRQRVLIRVAGEALTQAEAAIPADLLTVESNPVLETTGQEM
jgi:hypothetical protein